MKTEITSYLIRPVKEGDIKDLHANLNDPEVCRFLYVDYPVELEEVRSYWFSRMQNPHFHAWSAQRREDGRIMGVIGMAQYPQKKVGHNASLSLVVGCPFWKQGVGYSLLQYALKEAKKLGIKRIGLQVRETHLSAIQLYQKQGFIICGKRSRYFKDGDIFVDDLEMELVLK